MEQYDCCDIAESDPNHPDRFRWRIRSGRKWLCYQPQPPERKHHRISEFRNGNWRKMAGLAEGDRARNATSSIRVQPLRYLPTRQLFTPPKQLRPHWA